MCQTYILCCAKVGWDVGVLSNYFIYSSLCWFTASAVCCILNGGWKPWLYFYACNCCCVALKECPWKCWGFREAGEVKLGIWDECTVTWEYSCFHPRPWRGRASWLSISLTPFWLTGTYGTTDWTSSQSTSGILLRSMALLTPRLW